MLSAKRMIEIFCQRGGGKFANLMDTLTPQQITYLQEAARDEPIIAMMPSKEEWFVLSRSHLVFTSPRDSQKVPLDQIRKVEIPKSDLLNRNIKIDGGKLDVGLRDGRAFQIKVEPGGPYFGLMNVLMRVARLNRRYDSAVRPSGDVKQPTTNDERPATQL